jgi:hypothetical protein
MLLSSPNSIESTTTNYRNAIITFCQHVVEAHFKAKNWLTFDCHYTAPSAHILAAHEVTVCLFVRSLLFSTAAKNVRVRCHFFFLFLFIGWKVTDRRLKEVKATNAIDRDLSRAAFIHSKWNFSAK